MGPCLTLLTSHKGKHGLVLYLIRLIWHTLVFEVGRRESLEDGTILVLFHPHRHGDLTLSIHSLHHLIILYLGHKLRLDTILHLSRHLIIYIGVSIEMTTGEGEFFGRFHIERLLGGSIHHLHLLSEVMIEVIVGLVAPFHLLATEYVDVITTFCRSLHDSSSTLLLCLGLRF